MRSFFLFGCFHAGGRAGAYRVGLIYHGLFMLFNHGIGRVCYAERGQELLLDLVFLRGADIERRPSEIPSEGMISSTSAGSSLRDSTIAPTTASSSTKDAISNGKRNWV